MIEPKIKFSNVSKSYGKNSKIDFIFDKLNFEIFAHEFVCILGSSGTGKSTILGLISGFIKPDSGQVFFNSRLVTRPDSTRTLVFQDYALFPWLNVLDNVAFGLTTKNYSLKQTKDIALEYLNLVGLSSYKDYSISKLSGGMKQRIALARALAVDPEVLLLDEPFGSLDEKTRENMQLELLRLLSRTKKTVIFVTHSVDEALKLADRIIIVSGRPAKVPLNITIGASRPRDLNSMQMSQIRDKVLEKLSESDLFMGSDI